MSRTIRRKHVKNYFWAVPDMSDDPVQVRYSWRRYGTKDIELIAKKRKAAFHMCSNSGAYGCPRYTRNMFYTRPSRRQARLALRKVEQGVADDVSYSELKNSHYRLFW